MAEKGPFKAAPFLSWDGPGCAFAPEQGSRCLEYDLNRHALLQSVPCLCHGWSATPAFQLPAEVLGVKTTSQVSHCAFDIPISWKKSAENNPSRG
jgi:hypothetical protein